MDREWMSKPRASIEYKHGVEEFLSFAYRDVPIGEKILCPCVNCANKSRESSDEVKTHLRCDGILQDYTRWFSMERNVMHHPLHLHTYQKTIGILLSLVFLGIMVYKTPRKKWMTC
jgi:hypothetical protein